MPKQSFSDGAQRRSPLLEGFLLFVLFVALVSFCGVLYHYSALSDLLLEYPFWWPDTLDWTKQAIVILQKIGFYTGDPIFVWRPREPFFLAVLAAVLVTQAQTALLLLLALTQIVFSIGIFVLARTIGLTRRDSLFVAVLMVLNYSFQLFSYYIMSDFIAITAMTWASIFMVRALRERPEYLTVPRALLIFLAVGLSSVTQIFTLIPAIVFGGVYFVFHARHVPILRRSAPLLAGLCVVGAVRWLISLIKMAFFGTNLDDRLKYLKITTESFGFYGEALLIFCAPLILVGLLRLITQRKTFKFWPVDSVQLFLAGTTGMFLLLVLFYSTWQEARLLTFFLPLVYLLGFTIWGEHNSTQATGIFSIAEVILAIYLAMLPVNHIMAPNLSFYTKDIFNPLALASTNSFSFALSYKGEDRRMQHCVNPDLGSGQSGSGYFPKDIAGCDPYLHYNLRVYWCFRNGIDNCFKES